MIDNFKYDLRIKSYRIDNKVADHLREKAKISNLTVQDMLMAAILAFDPKNSEKDQKAIDTVLTAKSSARMEKEVTKLSLAQQQRLKEAIAHRYE